MAIFKNTTINDTGFFKLGEKANFSFNNLQNFTSFFYTTNNINVIALYFYNNGSYDWFYIVTE